MRSEIPFSEQTIDQVDRVAKDAELDEIVIDRWHEVVSEVLLDILEEPGWMLDPAILGQEIVVGNKELLDDLNENPIESLDELPGEGIFVRSFIFRFLEVFSQKFDTPYVFRGGDLSDLENGIRGSFTFFFDEAKEHVTQSYIGERENPCLLALPVAAIVKHFKENTDFRLFAEQGFDGIFSASLEVILPYLPEDIIVYLPDIEK